MWLAIIVGLGMWLWGSIAAAMWLWEDAASKLQILLVSLLWPLFPIFRLFDVA